MWAEALMSLEILGCCHLIQYRGVYLGRAKCHCCHLTSVPVYWIRPCGQGRLGPSGKCGAMWQGIGCGEGWLR
jgi:hypothetical protein